MVSKKFNQLPIEDFLKIVNEREFWINKKVNKKLRQAIRAGIEV